MHIFAFAAGENHLDNCQRWARQREETLTSVRIGRRSGSCDCPIRQMQVRRTWFCRHLVPTLSALVRGLPVAWQLLGMGSGGPLAAPLCASVWYAAAPSHRIHRSSWSRKSSGGRARDLMLRDVGLPSRRQRSVCLSVRLRANQGGRGMVSMLSHPCADLQRPRQRPWGLHTGAHPDGAVCVLLHRRGDQPRGVQTEARAEPDWQEHDFHHHRALQRYAQRGSPMCAPAALTRGPIITTMSPRGGGGGGAGLCVMICDAVMTGASKLGSAVGVGSLAVGTLAPRLGSSPSVVGHGSQPKFCWLTAVSDGTGVAVRLICVFSVVCVCVLGAGEGGISQRALLWGVLRDSLVAGTPDLHHTGRPMAHPVLWRAGCCLVGSVRPLSRPPPSVAPQPPPVGPERPS